MSSSVRAAFELDTVVVPLSQLLPTRQVTDAIRGGPRYRAIVASIAEVGLIEPPVVHPQRSAGTYLLLDGHLRVAVLRERGVSEVRCLVSTEDEGYTYNHKINRLAPIQEYRMIMKALDAGVGEERIARTLNLSIEAVRRRRTLLQGIGAEAVALLKDKPISEVALRLFRRVLPLRQIEIAELLVAANNYTRAYVQALVTRTPPESLTKEERQSRADRDPAADVARVEREVLAVERDFVELQSSYGTHFMHLTLARGYIRSLLDNVKARRYLERVQPDVLKAFEKLVHATSMDP